MGMLFSVTDPRGIIVTCDQSRWNRHICRTHPEVRDWKTLVQEAIQKPRFISASKIRRDTEVYYLDDILPDKYSKCWLRVLVRFQGRGQKRKGCVATAHAVRRLDKEEKAIWLRKESLSS